MSDGSVHCGRCGVLLRERENIPVEDRRPCPACGARQRMYQRSIAITQPASIISLRVAQKRPGFRHGPTILDMFSGIVPSHRFGRVFRAWVRDRLHDRYSERVVTLDGRTVHRCDEPLSAHTGHGAAKRTGRRSDDG